MDWPFGELTPGSYGCLVADPCWRFDNWSIKGIKKGARWHYDCLSVGQLRLLPVSELARDDAVMFLWCTGWSLANGDAVTLARSWGFEPKTEIVWRKTTPSGKVRVGPGYRARTMHEPILLCTKGRPVFKPLPSLFDGVAYEHSRKPDEAYKIIRTATRGLLWRCDLFSAGVYREGFESWGTDHRLPQAREDHAAALHKALQAGQPARPGR